MLSKANKVVYVSPFTLENQKIIYSEFAKKMYFYPIPYLNISLFQCNVSNRITLLYAGDYNSKIRNILPLYNSIAEENEKFKLNLVGNSDYILKNSNNISIQTRISYDEVKLLEKEADILVHLSNKHGTQIPGKIYQYSGTNKPILFILDGNEEEKRNIKNYFSQFDRYYFCENNENSIINILLQIKKDIKEKKYVPVKDFDKKIIAQNILKEVL
ncbi:hypothetical protein [Massilimicrobiota timonensis]|uniref:hypothetical protein n=1 Tax=Massilimicrobiota timonensis TaxID=1776392 RepID=UPI00101C1805|nr:hypothetical protein [Massilimicrobiota timonensis]